VLEVPQIQKFVDIKSHQRSWGFLYRGTVMRQSTATLRGQFVLPGDRGFKSELIGSDLVRCFVAMPLA